MVHFRRHLCKQQQPGITVRTHAGYGSHPSQLAAAATVRMCCIAPSAFGSFSSSSSSSLRRRTISAPYQVNIVRSLWNRNWSRKRSWRRITSTISILRRTVFGRGRLKNALNPLAKLVAFPDSAPRDAAGSSSHIERSAALWYWPASWIMCGI
ncbi:hypothetical protein QE152_g38219 [Popillia japonica]|uniref:Uncharacterized protein n=1 Tax=Popillia japonica TaxID=7064 RepID=A0AAW1I845_POPJA